MQRTPASGQGSAENRAAIPASASILPRSWHWARAAPPTVAARTRIVSVAGIRLDPTNLCDLSKGYFATTFLSSSLTCPARQFRLCGATPARENWRQGGCAPSVRRLFCAVGAIAGISQTWDNEPSLIESIVDGRSPKTNIGMKPAHPLLDEAYSGQGIDLGLPCEDRLAPGPFGW